jgi:hypothetical protein
MKQKKTTISPLGSIIKKKLIEENKTQKELAQEIGTSEKYLYLMLYGLRSGDKYISTIETVLGISLETYKKSA